MKKYNFNAGPSMLPREVIENTAKQILDFNGSGLSLMEISHRAKDFQPVVDETVALIKELLDIPEGYSVIFLGGGASLQFMQIPANFLIKKAGYVNTGTWAKKTTNNTIFGTELRKDIDSPVPLIADMSSDILSRPVDVSKYDAIYAGCQKNMGMAGVTCVILKNDKLGRAPRELPTMIDYNTHVSKGSMFNTPPVVPIYSVLETMRWVKAHGGVKEMDKRAQERARIVYDEIDRNKLFKGTVAVEDRSVMNLCFVMNEEYKDLEKPFLDFATERGMVGIKGHRSVGGFRASCYNAQTLEGVNALVQCMKDFEAQH